MLAVSKCNEVYSFNLPKQVYFSPYDDNGGSLIAIAGDDFVMIASDIRLSCEFSILSRDQSKLFKLSDKTVLGSAGCWCDSLTFARILQARIKIYELDHHQALDTSAAAQLISTMLYYKRFFPYYVSNVIAGLNDDGKGCIYTFDSIGHKQAVTYAAVGSCSTLLQPVLDNQIGRKNMDEKPAMLSLNEAVALVKDVFVSASERDIYTGDGIVIYAVTKDGIKEENFSLRKD